MKIICNCSTLTKGGALQAAFNFILQAHNDPTIEWHFLISKELGYQLKESGLQYLKDSRFYLIKESPAKNISSRLDILKVEKIINPDIIFTFFGPAYVNFSTKHLLGFAEPYVTHPNKYAYNSLGGVAKTTLIRLASHYKKIWAKKADCWVVEAEVAKKGLLQITGAKSDSVHIVPNGCRSIFYDIKCSPINGASGATICLLYLSAYYPHKNHLFLPEVAYNLKNKISNLNVKFVISLSENDKNIDALNRKINELNVKNYFDFIGPVKLTEAPDLYKKCHIAFIPTLLEAFSATYSESMACGMPVITSDMDFSRAICQDAAAYFPPNDHASAAHLIEKIIKDKNYRDTLISKGHQVACRLPKSQNKYEQYVSIIKSMHES